MVPGFGNWLPSSISGSVCADLAAPVLHAFGQTTANVFAGLQYLGLAVGENAAYGRLIDLVVGA
ncbi:MAG: hypothetical protein R3F24_04395 [Gammaproteobacteria bacterium]